MANIYNARLTGKVDINVYFRDMESKLLTLTNNDFEENSLVITASTNSGNGFCIGSSCMKELTLTLTREGMTKLQSNNLLRRKLCLDVNVWYLDESDNELEERLGFFYVNKLDKYDYYAKLLCYDAMTFFSEKVPESVMKTMQSEHTLGDLLKLCVSNVGNLGYVSNLAADVDSIKINSTEKFKLATDASINTYRDCIEFIAGLAGGFAYIWGYNLLGIGYYGKEESLSIKGEPDEILDVNFDPYKSKVVKITTSVGGFDYEYGSLSSGSEFDELTLSIYENPFLRGFVTEGEETENANVRRVFDAFASSIHGLEFYGGSVTLPTKINPELGKIVHTRRGIASIGSNVGVDEYINQDIMVTGYTWSFQNTLVLSANASVTNVNPSSVGINKGNVYRPYQRQGGGGTGEDNRLDEIANRLEDLGEQSFSQNMNLLNWAILARQQPQTDILSGVVLQGVKKITIDRGDLNYLNVKDIKISGRIISETVMPRLDWSDFIGYDENDIVLGKSLSVGCSLEHTSDLSNVYLSGGGIIYISFIVKDSGQDLTIQDIRDSMLSDLYFEYVGGDVEDESGRISFNENLFTSTGRFYYGQSTDGVPEYDYTDDVKDLPHKIYAEIINTVVDKDTYLSIDGMSSTVDLYLLVYGNTSRTASDSEPDSIINYSPLGVYFKSSVQETPNNGNLYNWMFPTEPDKPVSWWQKYYEEINYALDITFGLELASSPEAKASLMSYTPNPNTIDIIVKAIKDGVLPRNVEDLYTWVGYISDSLSSLSNYVMNSIGNEDDNDYTDILNKIEELSKAIETLTKSVSTLESNYTSLSSSVSENTSSIKGLDERVKKLEDNQGGGGGDTPTGSSSTPIARYTNEAEVVIDSSHSEILSIKLDIEKDVNPMLSFSATGGMSLEGLLNFHVFYDNSEIAFNPKFFVSKTYETISFSTSFLPISRDKRVTLSITCTTSDSSIIFPKDGISVSVINAELPKSDTEFDYAIPDVVIPSSIVSLRDLSDSVTTQ